MDHVYTPNRDVAINNVSTRPRKYALTLQAELDGSVISSDSCFLVALRARSMRTVDSTWNELAHNRRFIQRCLSSTDVNYGICACQNQTARQLEAKWKARWYFSRSQSKSAKAHNNSCLKTRSDRTSLFKLRKIAPNYPSDTYRSASFPARYIIPHQLLLPQEVWRPTNQRATFQR